jgi:hypothetical protein
VVRLKQGAGGEVERLTPVPESWWEFGRQEARGEVCVDSRGSLFAASLVPVAY